MAERAQQARHPRAVGARFPHEGRGRIAGGERGEHLLGIGDGFLGDDVAGFVQDAHRVVAIPEVQPNGQFPFGQFFNSRYFCFHKAGIIHPPSHSYLFGPGEKRAPTGEPQREIFPWLTSDLFF